MPLSPGTQLGPYEILARLGAGGTGEVYRARDPRANREVAIKVATQQFSERFNREARAAAALNHPNVCQLYDVGPNYLVMELAEGESPQGPLPLDQALHIARQIADALDAAHEKGIVHRDLKPGNIKVKSDGTVKVLDFGLAKIPDEGEPPVTVTQPGTVMGTPAYMSPEQAEGKPVDKRTDIWAFGVVLYQLLAGRRPFPGGSIQSTLHAVFTQQPDWTPIPAQARRLLELCLQKDPRKRLRDIGDAMAWMEASAAAPVSSRGAWMGWAAAAVIAIAAGIALWWTTTQ